MIANNAPPSDASVVTVEMELQIDAPLDRVWTAILNEPARWWPVEHRICGPSGKMTFEPKPGGRLFEEAADGGGLLWYTVLAIAPGDSLTLAGYIAPPWGGPATSLLRLAVKAEKGGTVLHVTDSLFGAVDQKFAASAQQGWQQILGNGLKKFVERA